MKKKKLRKNIIIRLVYAIVVILILALGIPVGYYVLEENSHTIKVSKKITQDAVGVYVINLDRSKERYEYIKKPVHDLGYKVKRISAVDGSKLSSKEIEEKFDAESYKIFIKEVPKLGTLGCSLSHFKVWEEFLQSEFEYALVFEDDVSFDPKVLREAVDELVKNHQLWDLNMFEIKHRGMPLTIKEIMEHQRLAVYLAEVTHSGAYLINRDAAWKLLQKAYPVKMPIDHYFTRMWEFDIKLTGIENPRLVHQTFGDSDIHKTKHVEGVSLSVVSRVKHSLFKFQSYIIRFLYNFKVYLVSGE